MCCTTLVMWVYRILFLILGFWMVCEVYVSTLLYPWSYMTKNWKLNFYWLLSNYKCVFIKKKKKSSYKCISLFLFFLISFPIHEVLNFVYLVIWIMLQGKVNWCVQILTQGEGHGVWLLMVWESHWEVRKFWYHMDQYT